MDCINGKDTLLISAPSKNCLQHSGCTWRKKQTNAPNRLVDISNTYHLTIIVLVFPCYLHSLIVPLIYTEQFYFSIAFNVCCTRAMKRSKVYVCQTSIDTGQGVMIAMANQSCKSFVFSFLPSFLPLSLPFYFFVLFFLVLFCHIHVITTNKVIWRHIKHATYSSSYNHKHFATHTHMLTYLYLNDFYQLVVAQYEFIFDRRSSQKPPWKILASHSKCDHDQQSENGTDWAWTFILMLSEDIAERSLHWHVSGQLIYICGSWKLGCCVVQTLNYIQQRI